MRGEWVSLVEGDLARVLVDVTLEGGPRLRADQNVLVESVIDGNPLVGVKWRDRDGTHVMALERSKLEKVL